MLQFEARERVRKREKERERESDGVRGKDRKYVWAAWPDKGGGNVPQALRQTYRRCEVVRRRKKIDVSFH